MQLLRFIEKYHICNCMPMKIMNIIEYLVLIVSEFASNKKISEAEAYAYLGGYGVLDLCEKHYGIMHTLSVEENIESLSEYCRRKGGKL